MILIKIHRSYRNVVAICDKELLGKKFEEGKKQLEITENFYNGKEISEEEAISLLKEQLREDSTFNIVGEKAIQTAFKAGVISEKSSAKVQGIPFALRLM